MEEEGATSERRIEEPLQLIKFQRREDSDRATVFLNERTIDRVFYQIDIDDSPVCVICVCGPSWQGKSLLLGYMIRCLEGLERGEDDWMGWAEETKPLKGFKFRDGSSPDTQGIWIWSKPFILKTETFDGREIAITVILMNSQGTCDKFTANEDMSAVLGLSLLNSNSVILNLRNNLQEDVLLALKTYIQYGNLALEKGKIPFQKLLFLIQDWNNPGDGEFSYGGICGQKYLNLELEVKDGQPEQAKHARKTIGKCFQRLRCFLMPRGPPVELTGSISEIGTPFAKRLEELINNVICPSTLGVEHILGNLMTSAEFITRCRAYVEIFNSDEGPTPANLWQATTHIPWNMELEKASKLYSEHMQQKIRGSSYVKEYALWETHITATKLAHSRFRGMSGSPETFKMFYKKLTLILSSEYNQFRQQNADRRVIFISEAAEDTASAFEARLKEKFPHQERTQFYDETEIKTYSNREKLAAYEQFRKKLHKESEEMCDARVEVLERSLGPICTILLDMNRSNCDGAEKIIEETVVKLTSDHRSKLKEYLDANMLEEDQDKLRAAHECFKRDPFEWYQQQHPNEPSSGNKNFQEKLQTNFDYRLEFLFATLKTEHQQRQQKLSFIKDYCAEYEAELQGAQEGELREIHSNKMISILEQLVVEAGSFHKNGLIPQAIIATVKNELQKVFDKFLPGSSKKIPEKSKKSESDEQEKEKRRQHQKKLQPQPPPQLHPPRNLPPLVFQLQASRLKMGMLIDGQPQVLLNELGEESTPLWVGLSVEGEVRYGTQVLTSSHPGQETLKHNIRKGWQLSKYFISMKNQNGWEEKVLLGDGKEHKITVEFLLAVILRKLKGYVESNYFGVCSAAIITVPFWACSAQRIQVKDAGKLAGFSEVYLVNEAAAAALACASIKNLQGSSHEILLLSENSGNIDASVYAYSSNAKEVTMTGHCGRSMDKYEKEGVSDNKIEKSLREICKEAMRQAQGNNNNAISLVFVICESGKWKSVLEKVGSKEARVLCDMEHAVLFGAALLSKNPQEIRRKVRDMFGSDVLQRVSGEKTGFWLYIDKGDLLPVNHEKLITTFRPTEPEGDFFQCVFGNRIRIGSLRVLCPISNLNLIEITFHVNNEAILEVRSLSYVLQPGEKRRNVCEGDYEWTSPNLKEDDFIRLRALLNSLQGDTNGQNQNELALVRQELLDKCKEMEDQGAGSQCRKKIQEARNVAQHPDANPKQLRAQMESLVKYSSKNSR